jgi:hypothetical protein
MYANGGCSLCLPTQGILCPVIAASGGPFERSAYRVMARRTAAGV